MDQISLVVTTKNEESTIARLLESITQQTRMPQEIILVDGGSADDTVSVIKAYSDRLPQLRVIVEAGANISQGRNRGIKESQHDVLAVTDAGCRLDPKWLELLSEKLDPEVMWCAGDHLPEAQNEFEELAGKCSTEGFFFIGKKSFKATARNLLFRKKAWEEVGGFPEDLEISEDAFFVLKLIEKGYKFQYVPESRVYWKPRSSYRGILTQFHRYAYWAALGGIALKIYRRPLFQQFILLLSLFLWLLLKKLYVLFLGLGLVAAYIFRKFSKGTFGALSLKKFLQVLAIQILIQVAISSGFVMGLLRRCVGKPRHRRTNLKTNG